MITHLYSTIYGYGHVHTVKCL